MIRLLVTIFTLVYLRLLLHMFKIAHLGVFFTWQQPPESSLVVKGYLISNGIPKEKNQLLILSSSSASLYYPEVHV